jgi:hypothetical protein
MSRFVDRNPTLAPVLCLIAIVVLLAIGLAIP